MSGPPPPPDLHRRSPDILDVPAGSNLHRFYTAAYDPIHFDTSMSGRFGAPDAGYSSALLELLLRTPAAPAIERRLIFARAALHAPHLIDLEIAQALRRYVHGGQVSAARGREALDDLGALRLTRWPHDPFLPRIWELRANRTAYDAAYVALAEALGAPLVTRDRRLAAAPGLRARAECL